MAKLLVDIGNTRLKFARSSAGRQQRMRAVEHRGSERRLAAALRASVGKVDEVVAVSVAGAAMEQRLRRVVSRVLRVPIRFVRSTTAAAGMTIGYREPWRLGADRWVALVGARSIGNGLRAVLVVDVGTAMTIDLVDSAGLHRGGAIVPGPELMTQSLLTQTRGIRARASAPRRQRSSGLFADNTRAGIEAGAKHAAAALIDRAMLEARRLLGSRPQLVLTGGAADQLAPLLNCPAELVPDLVLRGLARFAHPAERTR